MRAVIGGSGLYSLGGTKSQVSTPYGNAVVYELESAFFIPRHGENHRLPPFKVNYRANIYALYKLGVKELLTVHAVGVVKDYAPGDFILAEDFIGLFTPITFYESFEKGLRHADVSFPFSERINAQLKSIAASKGIELKEGGIIATTPGNRFETKAEIRALSNMGANLVSMTNAYEVTLANEIGMEISSLCIATNYAAGISPSPLSHEEVIEVFEKKRPLLVSLVSAWLSSPSP